MDLHQLIELQERQELAARAAVERVREHWDLHRDHVLRSATAVRRASSLDDLRHLNSETTVADRLARSGKGEARQRAVLERIIGENNLLDVYYLARGLEIARTVCRIALRNFSGDLSPLGTGFLVTPQLLMTNNHVIGDIEFAIHCRAQFGYEVVDASGKTAEAQSFALAPDQLFLTNQDLDYTLVAVHPQSTDGEQSLSSYGWNQLKKENGQVLKAERVTIIQHPGGRPKQIALRENKVIDILPPYLHYETDTEQGSSGAPVINDEWEVVALHRAGVPQTDAAGKTAWVANQGVLISWVLEDIERQSKDWGREEQRLLAEVLADLRNSGEGWTVPGVA